MIQEQHLVLLLLTLNIFHLFYTDNIAEFEQINAGWGWEMVVSDIFFLQLLEICFPMAWENLLGYMFSSLFGQYKVAKG